MQRKICSKCGKEKLLNEFHKDSNNNDGLRYDCKECVRKSKNEYDKNNKDKIKQYYLKNKEEILKKTKEYKDSHKKERHEYYLKNKYKQREQNRISRNKRLETNIQYKLSANIRTYIYLSSKRNTKNGKAIDLIGCSWDFLKQHLESQFKEGMSWNNYGRKGWHIDHIKPISKFDLTILEERRKCWNYTNLQPLWWYDNLKKYNNF